MTALSPDEYCGLNTLLSTALQAATPSWSELPHRWTLLLSQLVKGSEDSWYHSLGSLTFPQTQHAHLHLRFITCQDFVLKCSAFCFFKAESSFEAWLTFYLLPRSLSDVPSPAPPSRPALTFPTTGFWYHSMDPHPKASNSVSNYSSLLYYSLSP